MRVLCTFPGRAGDLLWALPSIRALSRRLGQPVNLQIAGEFASMVPLLQLQPYLGTLYADPRWGLTPPNEWLAPPIAEEHDLVLHLGYRGWPQQPLPFETLHTLNEECSKLPWKPTESYAGLRWQAIDPGELDLSTPWITRTPRWAPRDLTVAFSETHFELKYGLTWLLWNNLPGISVRLLTVRGSRWEGEGLPETMDVVAGDWLTYARGFAASTIALCCNSGAHVLAVAMGIPVILYEPMVSRHNPIFLPLGDCGPQVLLVCGNDGLPTTDARHTADALTAALARQTAGVPR